MCQCFQTRPPTMPISQTIYCNDSSIFHIAHFKQYVQCTEKTGAWWHEWCRAKPYKMEIQEDIVYMKITLLVSVIFTHEI